MTYRQALNQAQPRLGVYRRPLWRTLARACVDLCHALVLAALITVPGALMDLAHNVTL